MKNGKNISIEDLAAIIDEHLVKRGESPEFIAGYLAAMRQGGYLKATAPAWIRNSAALFYLLPPPPDKPHPPLKR